MSKIRNVSLINEEKVNNNRSAIMHRAAWMGLIYDEAEKAGADAESITRKAIARRGLDDAARIKADCKDPANLEDFFHAFLDPLPMNTFQMEVTECTKDDLKIEFHYCPLVASWQHLGFSDEACAKLCDIAMDGDRNIAKGMGLKLDLTDTIASGCPTCKLHFHK